MCRKPPFLSYFPFRIVAVGFPPPIVAAVQPRRTNFKKADGGKKTAKLSFIFLSFQFILFFRETARRRFNFPALTRSALSLLFKPAKIIPPP